MFSRCFLLTMLLASVGYLHAANTEDLFSGVVWPDGRERARSDYPDETVVVMYFSGECPSAAAYMNSTAKEIDALIEKSRKPMRMFCVTPDLKGAELDSWIKAHGYTGAVVGFDPANRLNISLKNIFHGKVIPPDGDFAYLDIRGGSLAAVQKACDSPKVGKPRYAVEGLAQAPALDLWWACERDRPQAVRNLLAAQRQAASRRKEDPLRSELGAVVDVVKAVFERDQAAAVAAAPSMAAYEALEAIQVRFDGFELKAVTARIRDLGKDKAMKDELAARDVWRQAQKLKNSPRRAEQQVYADTMVAMAKRWPNTVYGAKAKG